MPALPLADIAQRLRQADIRDRCLKTTDVRLRTAFQHNLIEHWDSFPVTSQKFKKERKCWELGLD